MAEKGCFQFTGILSPLKFLHLLARKKPSKAASPTAVWVATATEVFLCYRTMATGVGWHPRGNPLLSFQFEKPYPIFKGSEFSEEVAPCRNICVCVCVERNNDIHCSKMASLPLLRGPALFLQIKEVLDVTPNWTQVFFLCSLFSLSETFLNSWSENGEYPPSPADGVPTLVNIWMRHHQEI